MSPTFKKVVLWGSVTYAVLLAVFVLTGAVNQQPNSASADVAGFAPAGMLSGVATYTRNTTASATDPNSYITTDYYNSMSSKFQSEMHLAIMKSTTSGRYMAKFNYADNGVSYFFVGTTLTPTGGYLLPSATSSTFTWRRDASGNVNGLHAVFYMGMTLATLDVQPGINPITHASTNMFTLKATNYTGRYVYANRTGYFNPDSTTVTYLP